MNRQFNPTPILLRAVFATASLLASGLILGSMAGLADHYSDAPQEASAQRAVVAQR